MRTRLLQWMSGRAPGRLRRAALEHPRALVSLLALTSVAAWALFAYALWFAWDIRQSLPDAATLRSVGDMAQATTILDVDDRPVFTIFKEQRIEVPLEQLSPHMKAAVLSVEDQRFYEHNGVDIVRIGAAVVANARTGTRSQGGSTITQQLARQSFLTRHKTYTRKIKEAFAALLIEGTYPKDEILELYLNKVYFGDGFYGVEAAALGFLGKHAAELDVAEAALLAGLIQSPSTYAPTINMDKAVARRAIVLRTMLDSGAIDQATFDEARNAPVRLRNQLRRDEAFGLYFKEQVRRELVDRFGWELVSEGGLRVYTTIVPDLQQEAEKAVETRLRQIEERRGYPHTARSAIEVEEGRAPDYLQASVVVLDPATGAVRALVGGRNFSESRFNRVVQARRQSGSAFKPIVYAAAIEAGQSPGSIVSNLNDPINTPQGAYVPEDEHSAADSMTLRTGLRTSSNRAAVHLLRTVGIDNAVTTARSLSLGDMPAVPSMALGAGEVTLASLTAAYGAFATGGVLRTPHLIRRVESRDGEVLYAVRDDSRQVFSPQTAFLMTTMLADVINAGTGWRARAEGFRLPAAGKTGTTNDYHDVWFVGYTPKVVTGVWMGFDQPKPIIANGYAGELAVPLWASVMRVATKGDKPETFERPDGIVSVQVCRVTGKRASQGCSHVPVETENGIEERSMVYGEFFRRGTEPGDACTEHDGPGFWARLAGAFGKDTGLKPVTAEQAGLPSAEIPRSIPQPQVADVPKAAPAPAVAEADDETVAKKEPEKKRGFWGRLFGRRDKDSSDDDRKSPPTKKQDP
jgi:1A family penicillin-binding protein